MNVGSYIGDGTDDRDIPGVGFAPKYVIIKGNLGQRAIHKVDSLAGDSTLNFINAINFPDGIQALQADGFQVGTTLPANGNTSNHFWMAFRGASDNSLPVELSSFTAIPADGVVMLHWRTESESQNLGFNVYRGESPTGPFTKLNPTLIKGLGTSGVGREYQWADDSVDASIDAYYYYIEDVSFSGITNPSRVIMVRRSSGPLIPKKSALLQNYPNAFNPETWMPYQLSEAADIILNIYDVKGELVRTLELGHKLPGYYLDKTKAAYWDGRNSKGERVGSGVYFYSLRAGDFVDVRRMLLQK
jgi:hypothetical protein